MNLVWLLAPYIASSIAGDLSGRFDIRHVTNDTFDVLGITKSSFSVQDALFPTSYDSVLYDEFYDSDTKIFLFADACWQPSLNRWNCTLSCKDTSFMFSNLETLHNCMAFPEVAAHYYENNLTQIARALVAQLGIQASRNDSESNRNVTRLIQTCLTDYCTSIKGCHVIYDTVYGAGNENATAYRDPSNWDFREQGSLLMGAICESLRSQAQVNADIGGIGVYVSYWIQTGVALLAFIATMLWHSWMFFIYRSALTLKHGIEKAHEKARWIRIENQKHLSRLTVALTDFQKAQCFFMVAINIAAQVVIWRGGLQPNSLQQIYNTYVFIKVLAISGYLPITFTLFTLHIIGMVSWYLLALSVSSVALSVATLVTIGNFKPSTADLNDLASSYATGGPDSCGNVQLGAFCYTPFDSQSSSVSSFNTSAIGDAAFRMLAFCLVVLLLLVLEKAKFLQRPKTQRLMRWLFKKLAPFLTMLAFLAERMRNACDYPMTQRIAQRTSDLWSSPYLHQDTGDTGAIRLCIGALFYIVFSCLYIYWFSIFARLLGWFAANQIYSTTWNFGQIVAITVWAPPLCELIYLELRGMRRGFDHKLLPPYRLTREDSSRDVESRPVNSVPLATYADQSEVVDADRFEKRESLESPQHHSKDHYKTVAASDRSVGDSNVAILEPLIQ